MGSAPDQASEASAARLASDDLTPLGSRNGCLAIGPCEIRISGCAGRWAEIGSRPATMLMILVVDCGQGSVRLAYWVTAEHPPRLSAGADAVFVALRRTGYDRHRWVDATGARWPAPRLRSSAARQGGGVATTGAP